MIDRTNIHKETRVSEFTLDDGFIVNVEYGIFISGDKINIVINILDDQEVMVGLMDHVTSIFDINNKVMEMRALALEKATEKRRD